MFENYPNEAGLNAGDADLVDVIHTAGKEGNIMDYGTLKPMGHIDFYPNGGGRQPGCSSKDVGEYGGMLNSGPKGHNTQLSLVKGKGIFPGVYLYKC